MSIPRHDLALLCPFAVIAIGLPSQTIHVVGPGGHAQIGLAVAAAGPGDHVVVEPGTYAPFTVDRGVTVLARGVVRVFSNPFNPGEPRVCTFSPPAGQELHLVGLDFRCQVVATGGRITFDQCLLWTTAQQQLATAVLRCDQTILHLQDTLIRNSLALAGQGHALHLVGCATTMTGCELLAEFHSAPSAATVVVEGGTLDAASSSITGPQSFGSEALRLQGGATARLADCTLLGGGGSACLVSISSAQLLLARTPLPPPPYQPAGCPTGAVAADLLGVRRSGPLAPGGSFTLTATGTPLGLLGIWAGTALDRTDLPGVLAQPFWLQQASAFPAALMGLDANGDGSIAWSIPANPGLVGFALWLQAIGGPQLPLATSAVLGGVVR